MDHDERNQIEQLTQIIESLSSRVDELSKRLQGIEGASAEAAPPPVPDQSPTPPQAPALTLRPPAKELAPEPPTIQKKSIPSHIGQSQTPETKLPPEPAPAKQFPSPSSTRPAPFKAPPIQKPTRSKREFEIDFSKFEWLLGIKGFALLGVIIVVSGVGMFLKLAYDEGWIQAIPPSVRCLSAGLFGVVLVVVGEVLRKRINALASSGFAATGIATMYASVYAASRIFDLIGTELSFVMMFAITLLGIILGAIANRVMLALLSLVGAFLVPILLSTGEPSFVVMPMYLLMLLAIGVVLSGLLGGSYSHVRRLAWWGTVIVGTLWITRTHEIGPWSVLVFLTLAWMMTVIELIASSRFLKSLRERIKWSGACDGAFLLDDQDEIRFNPMGMFSREARWITTLFGATIWCVVSASLTIEASWAGYAWVAPAMFALLCVVTAMLAVRVGVKPTASVISRNSTPASLLLAAIFVTAATLTVAAIATAFGGWVEVTAWIAVGFAAVETARRMRFRALGVFGCGLIAYAIARLMTHDLYHHADTPPEWEFFRLAFTGWSLQTLLAALACVAVAWRSAYRTEGIIASSLAMWLVAVTTLHPESSIDTMGAIAMLISAGAFWISARLSNPSLKINSLVLAGLGSALVVLGQFDMSLPGDSTGLEVHVISVLLAMIAWGAIAYTARAGFTLRTVASSCAVVLGSIAILRFEQTHGMQVMLIAQGVYFAGLLLVRDQLRAWSVGEISASLTLLLAPVWGISQISHDPSTLDLVPMGSENSYSIVIALGLMMLGARLLPKWSGMEDEPSESTDYRELLVKLLLGSFWFFALIASTLEVVRATHLVFESRSAQGATVSIWWSLFGIASVALGFRYARALRWSGLTLLCIVAAKVLIIDTTTLTQGARVIASISVGLVIIVTAVLYTKLVDKLTTNEDDREPSSEN